MIRKKRTQSQVDLFSEEWLTPEPVDQAQNRSASPSSMSTMAESVSVSTAKRKTATTGRRAMMNDSGELFEPETEEITFPETDETPVPEHQAKKDQDSKDFIINRDFADGFYVKDSPQIDDEASSELRRMSPVTQWRLIKVLMLGFLVLILLTVLNWKEWITDSALFTLKEIVVQNAVLATREEVLELAGLEKGARLGTIDLAVTADRIKKNPLFRSASVSRSYPSAVVITLEERQPITFLIGQEVYAVDDEGIILPKLKPIRQYNLPVITGIRTAVKPGMKARSEELTTMLQFLKQAKEKSPALYFEISEIQWQKDRTQVYLNSMPVPFVADVSSPARTLLYLELAQDAFKDAARLKGIREIDLRYDGQLVIRKK